jgi:hypothetical protein
MREQVVRKARAAWMAGFLIVLAGFAVVVLFVVQSFAGVPLLPQRAPQIPAAWLDLTAKRAPGPLRSWIPATPPSGLPLGVLALATMMLGATIARRQIPLLEAAKLAAEDRLRRARQYAGDPDADGRIEPYIGSRVADVIDVEVEPK